MRATEDLPIPAATDEKNMSLSGNHFLETGDEHILELIPLQRSRRACILSRYL
jgi:hypothetical protein